MKSKTLQKRVWNIMQPDWLDGKPDWDSRIFDFGIIIAILVSIGGAMAASVSSIAQNYGALLYQIEMITVAIFTAEYIARLWACGADERWGAGIGSRLRYMATPGAIIDLLAVMPFYLVITLGEEWATPLLAARMLRLLKLASYFKEMRLLGRAIYLKRNYFFASGIFAFVVILAASVLMYAIEGEVQPEAFGSIPEAMWWGVVTLTTVGYGDVSPTTGFGQVVGGIVAFVGIGIVALPAAVFAGEFQRLLEKDGQSCKSCHTRCAPEDNFCPHCGENMKDEKEEKEEEVLTPVD